MALYPHVAPLLLHAGRVRERAGAWEEAEMLYRRAAEEDGELAAGQQVARATSSIAAARTRRRRAQYRQRAARSSPELGDDVYFKLGNIHYKQGGARGGRAASGAARWS